MSEKKHTPGPWSASCAEQGWVVEDANGNLIANIGQDDIESGDNCSEDARLIAAAPELLEALQYALPYLEAFIPHPRNGVNADCSVDVNCVDRARAAIAKATGAQS